MKGMEVFTQIHLDLGIKATVVKTNQSHRYIFVAFITAQNTFIIKLQSTPHRTHNQGLNTMTNSTQKNLQK